MKDATTQQPLLERYTKTKKIGKGAFGSCFLAKCVKSGETCVVKEVALRGMDAKEAKRSINEARVLQKLKHPHLISYRDAQVNKADAKLYIVMQYAAGGDLSELIAERLRSQRRFSEFECLKVLAQTCQALAYCHHSLYLLHRDCKPQNIFLSSATPGPNGRTPGNVLLGDFGISAQLSASHGLAMTKCGSPVYMSPELCAGRPYDRGCDVWALGCVIFEMMSLSTPWLNQLPARHGMMMLMRLICSGSLDVASLRKHYSDELVNLVAALLCKDARQRPSFRAVLRHPLIRRTLEELQPPGGPAPVTPPLSPESTPPMTPSSTPPLSPVHAGGAEDEEEEEDLVATGDVARPKSAPQHHQPKNHPVAAMMRPRLPAFAAPPPVFGAAPPRTNAADAAAKLGVNVYEELTRPGANYYADPAGHNPFNARARGGPIFKAAPHRVPYGVDAHAAAMAVQRSFHARRAQGCGIARKAAGMPSRPPARPAWAVGIGR